MESIFTIYAEKICNAIKKNKIKDFKAVRRRCIQNVNVNGAISLSEDTLSKIRNAKNFNDLFDILCCTPYWNWMNIRMLEKITGDCSEAKQLIDDYKATIFSKKVKDILTEIPILDIPKNKYTEVKEKWKKDFNDLTVKDIVERWNEIEKKFNVEETMLLQSITEGCVEVCWLLPNHLTEHAICSATNNQPGRHDDDDDQSGLGSTQQLFPEVLYLKIGDTVIKDNFISELSTKYVCRVDS